MYIFLSSMAATFSAESRLRGRGRFEVPLILEFIAKCIKCLNRAIYKYAAEVLWALKNSLFTLAWMDFQIVYMRLRPNNTG